MAGMGKCSVSVFVLSVLLAPQPSAHGPQSLLVLQEALRGARGAHSQGLNEEGRICTEGLGLEGQGGLVMGAELRLRGGGGKNKGLKIPLEPPVGTRDFYPEELKVCSGSMSPGRSAPRCCEPATS